jgi:hypothetical protein
MFALKDKASPHPSRFSFLKRACLVLYLVLVRNLVENLSVRRQPTETTTKPTQDYTQVGIFLYFVY